MVGVGRVRRESLDKRPGEPGERMGKMTGRKEKGSALMYMLQIGYWVGQSLCSSCDVVENETIKLLNTLVDI